MFDLKDSGNELSTLKGIERDIANDLITRKLFETDRRFQEIFKQNLIIALSRLIYIKMKYMAQKRNAKVSLIDLDQNVIAKMAESTKNNVITLTEINPEYLNKLFGITLNQFNAAYQNLRTELNASKIYSESFRYFLQRLIKIVNLLLSGKRDKASLTNLEIVIIKDLELFENEDIKSLNCNEASSKNKKSKKKGKWSFLDYDENGNNLNGKQQREAAAKFFLNIIIPDLIKRGIIDPDTIPPSTVLRTNGYYTFIRALSAPRKISYQEVVWTAGFHYIGDHNIYITLRKDAYGNPQTR